MIPLLPHWVRVRESNPPGRAYEALLIPDHPLSCGLAGLDWCDRPGSNRLPPGYGPSVLPSGPRRHWLEWTEGLEPSPSAWGADVLPHDTTPTGRSRPARPGRDLLCVGLRSGPLVVQDLVQRVENLD